MSKIEVNTVEPQCGTTLTLGASGDTVTIPSGATISNLGTAAGFGSTGEVSWDTTKKTTGFTATSGVGYFCDTTSAAFTVTLPATPSAGNVVAVSDYAGTFGTNGLTIGRNGSNINGSTSDFILNKNNVTAQFIYVDATQGWRVVFTGDQSGSGLSEAFITATGGTITECGSCRIHTFTGPGSFAVSQIAECSANNQVSYMVVAGGGGGASTLGNGQGGGGAGGFREDKSPITPYTASPLEGAGTINVTATSFPITVGGGGAGGSAPGNNSGVNGNNSVFSTITSAGGGLGANEASGGNGGSGGGGGSNPPGPQTGGNGNTPPVSPPQGNNGGSGFNAGVAGGGGGGGALGGGSNTPPSGEPGGNGGSGTTTGISGSSTGYAGGGGGGSSYGNPNSGGTATQGGGAGGGGPQPTNSGGGTPGTANTGGGGGGNGISPSGGGGNGGSGIVIIRYKFQ